MSEADWVYTSHNRKIPGVIVDIDGTIADIGHRIDLIRDKPKDWKGFHSEEKLKIDAPILDTIKVINQLAAHNRILFVTGRPVSRYLATERWLREHLNFEWIEDAVLLMRLERDHRPDYDMKRTLYYEMIEPNYDILCVFEDRDQVVNMWREEGLTCYQVCRGNY